MHAPIEGFEPPITIYNSVTGVFWGFSTWFDFWWLRILRAVKLCLAILRVCGSKDGKHWRFSFAPPKHTIWKKWTKISQMVVLRGVGVLPPSICLAPLRPLARPCIVDASISCSENPICPKDVIERTGVLYKSPFNLPVLVPSCLVDMFFSTLSSPDNLESR